MAEQAGTTRKRAWAAAAAALLLAFATTGRPYGEVLFTGLDDSCYSILARSGTPGLVGPVRDVAFEQVPEAVRPDVLYRPAAARKTRDLAHQLAEEPQGAGGTGGERPVLVAKPFFPPFLPLQRALFPRLPLALALAVFAVVALGPGRDACAPLRGRAARALLAACGAVGAATLTPWHTPHYLAGPFAEGPATLFAALAMALSFAPRSGALRGGAVGFLLGLSATFHPTLAAYAVPVAAFSVLRSGRPRHVLALAAGAAAGLAPLVWSTLCVTAPYGNFLSPRVLAEMIRGSRDIAALASALVVAVPGGLALAALSLSPRARAFFDRDGARTAVAAASALAAAGAAAAVFAIPAARAGFSRAAAPLAFAAPFLLAALALAFAKRRGASCALLAFCAWAAVPFFVVQGQEVHVGLWSLRRTLPPAVLCSVAAACAALERASPRDGARRAALFAALGRAAAALAAVCGCASLAATPARLAFVPPRGDAAFREAVAARIGAVAAREGAGPLLLFDSFRHGAPFAAERGRRAFCLADAVSRRADPSRVAGWLLAEARAGRPAYVVSSQARGAPVAEDGFSLVPEGEPVRGVLTRVGGRGWDRAAVSGREVAAAFLRVVPDGPESPRRFALDFSAYDAFPFGLRGGWAAPRPGKPGRWASDGAAFCAPVPPPGGAVEIRVRAAWTPPPELGDAPQTLRLVPPFPCDGAPEAELAPGRGGASLRFVARRRSDDDAPRGASGAWTLRAARAFDAEGFPPRLAAQVFRIESGVVPSVPGVP